MNQQTLSNKAKQIVEILQKPQNEFVSVVPIDFEKENWIRLDLSAQNPEISSFDLQNVEQMTQYIFGKMKKENALAAVGGYNEDRSVYQKSTVFDDANGSRSIHLGVDIWMPAHTPVFTPLEAKVHSFQNNAHFGDYGPTLILEHSLENSSFYTLYGHLTLESLDRLYEGKIFQKGEKIAKIGDSSVNGNWAPHLHFQVIVDLLGKKGDFIGVAHQAERTFYLTVCPNPNLILRIKGLDS